MQLLDAALIIIPASFFFLMAADFISGLVALFNSQSLRVEDVAHILQIIDAVPQLETHIENCIEEDSEELEYSYLPDPWMLATELEEAISQGLALRFAPTTTAPTNASRVRLLPPAKAQIVTLDPVEAEVLATFMPIPTATAKRGRPRKESTPAPVAATPKRKAGRPRKTV